MVSYFDPNRFIGSQSPLPHRASEKSESRLSTISLRRNLNVKKPRITMKDSKDTLNLDLVNELNSSVNNFKKREQKKHSSNTNVISVKSKRLNQDSLVHYLEQLKGKRASINFEAALMEETAKEISIHTPKAGIEQDDKSILWADINQKLSKKKDLDEDELLEMKQHLEQKKREALVKDILSGSFEGRDIF